MFLIFRRRTSFADFTVRIGSIRHSDPDENAVVVNVQSYHVHDRWRSNFVHDIALIKLAQTVTLNDYIQPVCLHATGQDLGLFAECFTAGWGSTSQDSRPVIPDSLLELKTSFISDENCQLIMEFHSENWFSANTMLCTGTEAKTASICKVGSGYW